jgi:hypothetical protein
MLFDPGKNNFVSIGISPSELPFVQDSISSNKVLMRKSFKRKTRKRKPVPNGAATFLQKANE